MKFTDTSVRQIVAPTNHVALRSAAGGRRMITYRVYCMDGEGRIHLADWIDAKDDVAALQQARALKRDAIKCEVWQKDRLVASLTAGDRQASS